MSDSLLVRCIANTGTSLGPSRDRYFHSERTQFHLTQGAVYRIVGMGIWETVLLVLLRDDTHRPRWLPVALFEFLDYSWPSSWEFVILDRLAASGADASDRWVALWGYGELVRDPRHSDELVNGDPAALEIFDRHAPSVVSPDD